MKAGKLKDILEGVDSSAEIFVSYDDNAGSGDSVVDVFIRVIAKEVTLRVE